MQYYTVSANDFLGQNEMIEFQNSDSIQGYIRPGELVPIPNNKGSTMKLECGFNVYKVAISNEVFEDLAHAVEIFSDGVSKQRILTKNIENELVNDLTEGGCAETCAFTQHGEGAINGVPISTSPFCRNICDDHLVYFRVDNGAKLNILNKGDHTLQTECHITW